MDLKELNKNKVVNKNLHGIKNEKLVNYTGDFELFGNLKIGDQTRQTHISFISFAEFEAYINSTGETYDVEDAVFYGYI